VAHFFGVDGDKGEGQEWKMDKDTHKARGWNWSAETEGEQGNRGVEK